MVGPHCTLHSCRRLYRELHQTIERIRIVKHGGVVSLLMRSYPEDLQWDHVCLLRFSLAAFAALHIRAGPTAHPDNLRYTQTKHVSSEHSEHYAFERAPQVIVSPLTSS